MSAEQKAKISKARMGRKLSQATKDKMSKPKTAEHCSNIAKSQVLDNSTNYNTLHNRVRKLRGTPSKCEHCGTTDKRVYHWSNKDHVDYQNMDNYQRLCVPCHKKYDREKGLI